MSFGTQVNRARYTGIVCCSSDQQLSGFLPAAAPPVSAVDLAGCAPAGGEYEAQWLDCLTAIESDPTVVSLFVKDSFSPFQVKRPVEFALRCPNVLEEKRKEQNKTIPETAPKVVNLAVLALLSNWIFCPCLPPVSRSASRKELPSAVSWLLSLFLGNLRHLERYCVFAEGWGNGDHYDNCPADHDWSGVTTPPQWWVNYTACDPSQNSVVFSSNHYEATAEGTNFSVAIRVGTTGTRVAIACVFSLFSCVITVTPVCIKRTFFYCGITEKEEIRIILWCQMAAQHFAVLMFLVEPKQTKGKQTDTTESNTIRISWTCGGENWHEFRRKTGVFERWIHHPHPMWHLVISLCFPRTVVLC